MFSRIKDFKRGGERMISFRFKIIKIKSNSVSILPQLLKDKEILFEWNAHQVNKDESIGFEFIEDNLIKNYFHLKVAKDD